MLLAFAAVLGMDATMAIVSLCMLFCLRFWAPHAATLFVACLLSSSLVRERERERGRSGVLVVEENFNQILVVDTVIPEFRERCDRNGLAMRVLRPHSVLIRLSSEIGMHNRQWRVFRADDEVKISLSVPNRDE